jgi:hypothetical protein
MVFFGETIILAIRLQRRAQFDLSATGIPPVRTWCRPPLQQNHKDSSGRSQFFRMLAAVSCAI